MGKVRKIRIPKDLLVDLYIDKGLTLQQIAEEFGVNRQTISNKLKEYDIPIRNYKYLKECKKVSKKKRLRRISDYRNKKHDNW